MRFVYIYISIRYIDKRYILIKRCDGIFICDLRKRGFIMKLEVKNIRKSFGDKEVLHDISFDVESGKALGLLGRNGAGKTTTIRILMDVFHANSGTILLDGKPFLRKEHQIGYLPEERGLYPKKTVIEQIVYLAKLRGLNTKEAKVNARKWLERLEVIEYENKKLETLSKGNQQKVQLASTLVCDPNLVILDEPFSGLDPVNSQILQDVVIELIQSNKIVIFSSHQMSYVEEFCEDVVIINHGAVVLSGNLWDIKKEFGKNQLVLRADNYNLNDLEKKCNQNLSNYMSIVSKQKDYLILKLINGSTRNQLLEAILKTDIEIECFEVYKPSLNDIFVAQVGDGDESTK